MSSPIPRRTCCERTDCQADRRSFLLASGLASSTVLLKHVFHGTVFGADAELAARVVTYPRVKVVPLDDLRTDQPQAFTYPLDAPHCGALIVKLGVPAGGGIGPQQDIVAFNTRCTHMGGDLWGLYQPQYKVLGPCQEHLTTFDLRRHGMLVAGHATESLPQIVLEQDGPDLFAVGIAGLIYGYQANPATEPNSNE